jgi:hypothetical protein
MLDASVPSLAVLGLVTLVGVVFAYDGYRLVNQLLAWTGWIAGGATGGGAGWLFAANASGGPDMLVAVGGGLVVGGVLGRILVPLVSWLAVVLIGFVSTSLAVALFLTGREISRTASRLQTDVARPDDVRLLIEQIANLPAFQDQQVVLVTLAAGVVGALLASKFYDLLVTAAIGTVGAALLSAVIPIWQRALSGSVELSGGLDALSTELFALVLVSGLALQVYRYGDELDLPFADSDYDPLNEQ